MKEKLHKQINQLVTKIVMSGKKNISSDKFIKTLKAIQKELDTIQEIPLDVDKIHWEIEADDI